MLISSSTGKTNPEAGKIPTNANGNASHNPNENASHNQSHHHHHHHHHQSQSRNPHNPASPWGSSNYRCSDYSPHWLRKNSGRPNPEGPQSLSLPQEGPQKPQNALPL